MYMTNVFLTQQFVYLYIYYMMYCICSNKLLFAHKIATY